MVRIVVFSAFVAGLLLVTPAVFSDAEAGWTQGVAPKADRLVATLPSELHRTAASEGTHPCIASLSKPAESWCVAR